MSGTQTEHSDSFICRVSRAIATYIGFGEDDVHLTPSTPATQPNRPVPTKRSSLQLVQQETRPERNRSHALARHPQLRTAPGPVATRSQRSAQHDAMRGLAAAKSGNLEVALRHWRRAVSTSDIDLTAIPEFWDLTRGQMMAAIDAYEQAGKYQEAAWLDEQLSSTFRPTLVGTAMSPARSRGDARRAAN